MTWHVDIRAETDSCHYQIEHITVVGAGFMGTVIATIYAHQRYKVILHDNLPGALDSFRERALPIAHSLATADDTAGNIVDRDRRSDPSQPRAALGAVGRARLRRHGREQTHGPVDDGIHARTNRAGTLSTYGVVAGAGAGGQVGCHSRRGLVPWEQPYPELVIERDRQLAEILAWLGSRNSASLLPTGGAS